MISFGLRVHNLLNSPLRRCNAQSDRQLFNSYQGCVEGSLARFGSVSPAACVAHCQRGCRPLDVVATVPSVPDQEKSRRSNYAKN